MSIHLTMISFIVRTWIRSKVLLSNISINDFEVDDVYCNQSVHLCDHLHT